MDKLLWQIELVPPEASNLKSVSQVLNKYQDSSSSGAQTTRKTRREMKRTSETAEEYAMRLDEIRRKMNLAEEGSRFFNKSTDEGINTIKAQGDELMKLRSQIEANVDSRKERLKLLKRADAGVKRSQLGISRLRNNFTSMSASINQGNNTLISTGRILQDLPYGFIGISNNIEQLAFNFRNLTSSINPKTGKQRGFVGALSAVKSQFFGSGGLLFVLGSALPFALTTATNGFPGFRNMMADTAEDVGDLDEDVQTLIDSLSQYSQIEGEDPLGLREVEADIASVEMLSSGLDKVAEKRAELNRLRSPEGAKEHGVAVRFEISETEEALEGLIEKTGLSEEQVFELLDAGESLSERLAKLEKQGNISFFTAKEISSWERLNELTQDFDLGISRMNGNVSETVTNLEEEAQSLETSIISYQLAFEEGNEKVLPHLKLAKEQLGEVKDRLDEIPEKPVVDLSVSIDDEPIEPEEIQFPEFDLADPIDLGKVTQFQNEMAFESQLAKVDGFEAEKLKIKRKYEKKRQKLIESGVAKYVDMKLLEKAKHDEIERAKQDSRREMFNQTFSAITQSASQMFGALSELNQAQSDETEAQARKKFQTQKKLSIASARVASLEAFTLALTEPGLTTFTRIAKAGVALASGMAKVKAIKRTTFDNSSFEGSGSGSERTVMDEGFNERDISESSRNPNETAIKELAKSVEPSKNNNIFLEVKTDITGEKVDAVARRGRAKKTTKALKVVGD